MKLLPLLLGVLLLVHSAHGHDYFVTLLGRKVATKDDHPMDDPTVEFDTSDASALRLNTAPVGKVDASSTATLTASPGRLCARNGSFQVQWSGVSSPQRNDWIGVYTPTSSGDHDYTDWFYARRAATWSEGSGSVTFSLLNMRTDMQFRYFAPGYVRKATSNVIEVCQLPMQGHLSLTGDVTEMRLMWVSSRDDDKPTVWYGTDPKAMNSSRSATSHTYSASDMCGEPANITSGSWFRDPGFMHDALMTDLQPNTRYYYYFGSATSGYTNETFSFTTAPEAGPTVDVRFIAYGDMGGGILVPPAALTAKRVVDQVDDIDFVLHVGDISYARGHAWVWEYFGNLIEGIATRVPYMLGVGNHEYDHTSGGQHDPSKAEGVGFHPSWGNYGDDSHGECGRPLYERFHMPDNGDSLWWYSFDYGSVHIVHFSTEHDFTLGSPQSDWIKRDLQNVDRSKTPWLIVAGHRPMYTSEDYPSDYEVSLHVRSELEDIFHDNQVDLAIYGHYHAYERTCAVYQEKCLNDGTGTVHIVVGTAGASIDGASWMDKPWSVHHANTFGYGRVTVTNQDGDSTLVWEFVENDTDAVTDKVSLSKTL